MKKNIAIYLLTIFTLGSCANRQVFLYVHKTDRDDGDIFGYPKEGFFGNNANKKEITKHVVVFEKSECRELEILLDSLKSRPDLDEYELGEGPHSIALIFNKDTLYQYGSSWMWKKKVVVFKSPILEKRLKSI